MADLKISQLTAATTPLAGTEVVPLVQSGTTKKVSVADLTVGRTVTAASVFLPQDTGETAFGFNNANQGIGAYFNSGADSLYFYRRNNGTTLAALDRSGNFTPLIGNVVIGTSGKGIDFSATSGTGTSELLADYEEGTWTPVVVGSSTAGTGTYTIQSGVYTKVGRQVTVGVILAWSAHTGTGTMSVTGLPFANNAAVDYTGSPIAFNLTLTALNTLICRINKSATAIEMLQTPTGGGAWSGVAMDASVDALFISATYSV